MHENAKEISLAGCDKNETFKDLYTSVYKELYRFALYYLGSEEDAADAVQDAALDAYRSMEKLREAAKFRSWIFKILSAKCKKILSKRIQSRTNIPVDFASISDFSSEFTQSIELMALLESLAPSEKEIILLSVVAGYDSGEIGKMLNRPAGTVRSRLSRALAKLRL